VLGVISTTYLINCRAKLFTHFCRPCGASAGRGRPALHFELVERDSVVGRVPLGPPSCSSGYDLVCCGLLDPGWSFDKLPSTSSGLALGCSIEPLRGKGKAGVGRFFSSGRTQREKCEFAHSVSTIVQPHVAVEREIIRGLLFVDYTLTEDRASLGSVLSTAYPQAIQVYADHHVISPGKWRGKLQGQIGERPCAGAGRKPPAL